MRYYYGNVEGGKLAAITNKQRYGEEFYRSIGKIGGQVSRGGGFAASHELAVEAGRRGGKASRRTKSAETTRRENAEFEREQSWWAGRVFNKDR